MFPPFIITGKLISTLFECREIEVVAASYLQDSLQGKRLTIPLDELVILKEDPADFHIEVDGWWLLLGPGKTQWSTNGS